MPRLPVAVARLLMPQLTPLFDAAVKLETGAGRGIAGSEAAFAWMESQIFIDDPEPVH